MYSTAQAAARELRRKHLTKLKNPTSKRLCKFNQAVTDFKAKYPQWRDEIDFTTLSN